MGCCSIFGRFLLFALNITTFLIGIAFIVIGIIYEVGFIEVTDHLDNVFPAMHVAPILLIVVGCVIFIISFLGCCGAWRRSSCMLLTYAVVLIIILLLQIALAIYAFIVINNSDDWKHDLIEALRSVFDRGDQQAIEFFQQTLQCCGFDHRPVFIPASLVTMLWIRS
ncbi:Tetraspanin family [Popillia japonica]|uniref:Tetraspanin family n=1 Tax=Popillia japonica TaxID=7064 RepID=A0AAW1LY24_POPJA